MSGDHNRDTIRDLDNKNSRYRVARRNMAYRNRN